MFDINIKFIVFTIAIDKDTINSYILSSNQDTISLPSLPLDAEISIENAKKLCFENYVGLKIEWIEHKLIDITRDQNTINIYYTCNIPKESKLINGFFIPTNKALFEPVVQKAARFI